MRIRVVKYTCCFFWIQIYQSDICAGRWFHRCVIPRQCLAIRQSKVATRLIIDALFLFVLDEGPVVVAILLIGRDTVLIAQW